MSAQPQEQLRDFVLIGIVDMPATLTIFVEATSYEDALIQGVQQLLTTEPGSFEACPGERLLNPRITGIHDSQETSNINLDAKLKDLKCRPALTPLEEEMHAALKAVMGKASTTEPLTLDGKDFEMLQGLLMRLNVAKVAANTPLAERWKPMLLEAGVR